MWPQFAVGSVDGVVEAGSFDLALMFCEVFRYKLVVDKKSHLIVLVYG